MALANRMKASISNFYSVLALCQNSIIKLNFQLNNYTISYLLNVSDKNDSTCSGDLALAECKCASLLPFSNIIS